jgi:hypothetical protein
MKNDPFYFWNKVEKHMREKHNNHVPSVPVIILDKSENKKINLLYLCEICHKKIYKDKPKKEIWEYGIKRDLSYSHLINIPSMHD